LTAFVLGRLDQWAQATGKLIESPRLSNGWNQYLFSTIAMGRSPFTELPTLTPLRTLISETLGIDQTDALASLMVLELDLYNNQLNAGNKLTQFDFKGKKSGAPQMDAVVFIPTVKTILFIEAKLDSDLHDEQIMRILQAAFFLTHHRKSQFKYYGWKFHFVLLCPEIVQDSKMKYAPYLLDAGGYIRGRCEAIRPIDEAQRREFESFSDMAAASASHWYWSELVNRLVKSGWDRDKYHQKLRDCGEDELAKASINRLKLAGV
jgi:hypothetical protein